MRAIIISRMSPEPPPISLAEKVLRNFAAHCAAAAAADFIDSELLRNDVMPSDTYLGSHPGRVISPPEAYFCNSVKSDDNLAPSPAASSPSPERPYSAGARHIVMKAASVMHEDMPGNLLFSKVPFICLNNGAETKEISAAQRIGEMIGDAAFHASSAERAKKR